MGAGSVLIPGSNDGLILVGMPLLFPYAWVGIGTMCLTILTAIGTERLWTELSTNRRAAG
jgi:toxin CptA